MTSRQRTIALSRPAAGNRPQERKRTAREWATLLAFAALNGPLLLKGLYGGSTKAKQALLDELGLPANTLPKLGGWRADVGLLRLLVDHIFSSRPRTVVEFGGGVSTLIIARALQMCGHDAAFVSVDHNREFSKQASAWLKTHGVEADLQVRPLVPSPNGWPGLWYDSSQLPDEIDLMLVDGPPWTIHPLTRGAAESLFDRISAGGVVMLDDAARPGERIAAARWRKSWPDFQFELSKRSSKGTLIGKRMR